MKKEMIICIIIIALIIITNIIAQNYTKVCVENITQKLYELEEAVIEREGSKEEQITSIVASKENQTHQKKFTENNQTYQRKVNLENQIHQKVSSIDSKWHEFHNKLAFYIEHDELEKVETEISNIKGLEKVNKYDDMLPQIEECIFLLEHIRDKHTLTPINIF